MNEKTSNGLLSLPALIVSLPQFQLEEFYIGCLGFSWLIVRVVSGGEGPGPIGREFTGWRDCVGRVGGWW